MITASDVNAVTFEKAMRGYRAEDVDKILDDVAAQLEADDAEIASLKKQNEELKKSNDAQKENMYLLAQKIEEYRADEDNLKSALINAQRMGENVIREAKQKADGMLRDAAVRAEEITHEAQQQNTESVVELQRVKAEVAQFKADVLSLYKRHIESLSTLPEEEVEKLDIFASDDVSQTDEVEQKSMHQEEAAVESVVQQEVFEVETSEVESIVEQDGQVDFLATLEQPVVAEESQASAFWTQDEKELKEVAPIPVQESAPVFDAFRGIKFSD